MGRGGEGQLNEQQADDPGQVATALAAVSAALGVAVPAQAEAVQCNVKCNPNVKLHHGAIDCAHLIHAGRDVVAPEGARARTRSPPKPHGAGSPTNAATTTPRRADQVLSHSRVR